MKILDMQIDWRYKYGNSPDIKILVDEIPDDLVYEVMTLAGNSELYFAEKDGYVNFYSYKGPDNGFGGKSFELNLGNGESVILIGPWSSRTGVMNKFFPPSREVSMTTNPEVMEKGITFSSGYVTVELLREAMKKFCPDHELIMDPNNNEPYFIPVKKGVTNPCKRCKGSGRCDGALNWNDPIELIRCPECGGRGQAR